MGTAKLPTISALPLPPKGKSKFHRRPGPRGFGVRVTGNGVKTYGVRHHDTIEPIGRADAWTEAQARERAKEIWRLINSGEDLAGDRREARAAPSMRDLAERYIEEALSARRPSTAKEYRREIAVEILPALGSLKVAAVTPDDIDRLHRKITAGLHRKITARPAPYVANRVHALLSRMFSLAVRWKMRPDNPCRGVARNKEHPRERYLNEAELDALLDALDAHPDRQAANIFWLLLSTGARLGEVRGMKWEALDLAAGIWSKPAASTKQNRPHRVPLSAPVIDLLVEIRDDSTGRGEFVFPGRAGKPRVGVQKPWAQVCKSAGIDGLRMHDLRHCYASFCVNSGLSLQIIGGLLGHSNPATTARYSHLFDDTLREATNRVGKIIGDAGKPRLKVVK